MHTDLTKNFTNARKVFELPVVDSFETGLSQRERDVMMGVGHGERVDEIAKRMHISPSTISTYKQRVMQKLGFTRDAELIIFVYEMERRCTRDHDEGE